MSSHLKNLVVTGGLGFIGSNFIRYILKTRRDIRVTNVDNESVGSNPLSLQDVIPGRHYRFVKGDLSDYQFTRRVLKSASIVVNFAAQTHVDRSIANAEPFFESNTRTVFNLVRAVRDMKVESVVHVSTDEVYGSIDRGSFDKNSPLNPSSPYSATKASADLIVHAWNATYKLGIITLRCTNNFGPFQYPEKFIPKTIIRALYGREIPLYGGGRQIRDWIFVGDFCSAIDLAIDKGDPGEVYNVSAGNELSNRDVAEGLLKLLTNPAARLVDVEDRPGHDYRYSLSSEKARLKLGWKPAYKFDDALAETVKWYREHTYWWKRVATAKVLSGTPWKEHW